MEKRTYYLSKSDIEKLAEGYSVDLINDRNELVIISPQEPESIYEQQILKACFNCGKNCKKEDMHYWYHGDQDDLVCESCARKLKHTDTDLRGLEVLR